MTLSNINDPEDLKEANLTRRDWILLPTLSLLTICVLTVSTECLARLMFSKTENDAGSCMVLDDPSTGPRGIPGCVTWEKIRENQPVEYRFNRSGYRADVEFGPKSPATYRIVMVGSSFALGMRVPVEKAFATLLPEELSRRTGRKVELFNEGMAGEDRGGGPPSVALRLNDALAAKPDMILWILTAWDTQDGLDLAIVPAGTATAGHETFVRPSWRDSTAALVGRDAPLRRAWRDSATAFALRYFLYQSKHQFVRSSLMHSDYVDFLEAEPDARYQSRLQLFARYADEIEARARAEGVPLVAVLVPNRVNAAMISMGEWPKGWDPYKLDNELRTIITSHGGTYVDILPYYRDVTNPEEGYFQVDGHLNAGGNAVVSDLLAKALISGAVPALDGDTQIASAKGH